MGRYQIPKRTQTHADIWAALGWAGFCDDRARLMEKDGRAFTVEGTLEWPATAGYEFLKEKHDSAVPDWTAASGVFEYPTEKARSDVYKQAVKEPRQGGRRDAGRDRAAE